jgi:hypothetical protein
MAGTKEIYMLLFAGETVKIPVADRKEFESLRVMLHREHQTAWALEMTNDSLCGSYDKENQIASYWLGKARTLKRKDWKILPDEQDQ